MNQLTPLKKILAALLGISILVPAFAFAHEGDHTTAQAGAGVNAQAQANIPGARIRAAVVASTTAETTRAARAKERAAEEIDRRIASLNALLARVNAMEKVSDTFKVNMRTNVQTQIDTLNALRAKIEADTDINVLKTDVQSISQSYRIYALIMPQGAILAAADRTATVINMMGGIGAKLQARIQAEKNAGKNTTSLETSITTFAAKLDSAAVHAQTAVTLIAPLAPDNGDKTLMASNLETLKKARDEIKAAHADLVSARQEITTIVQGLRSISGSATTTVQTR